MDAAMTSATKGFPHVCERCRQSRKTKVVTAAYVKVRLPCILASGEVSNGMDRLDQLRASLKRRAEQGEFDARNAQRVTARRRDKYAKARRLRLRSADKPDGLETRAAKVKEANFLASRAAQLCLLQWKTGGWFSTENPEGSLIWLRKPARRWLQLDGVQCYEGDQCCFTGELLNPQAG